MIPLILTRRVIVIRGPGPQKCGQFTIFVCICMYNVPYTCVSVSICMYMFVYSCIYIYICLYVPEVPPRRRPVRRRAVRLAGRQEVATGYLRHHRELATGHHLPHPCPPGCLIPTHTLVSGPAGPIVRPSPRPAGPGRTSRS